MSLLCSAGLQRMTTWGLENHQEAQSRECLASGRGTGFPSLGIRKNATSGQTTVTSSNLDTTVGIMRCCISLRILVIESKGRLAIGEKRLSRFTARPPLALALAPQLSEMFHYILNLLNPLRSSSAEYDQSKCFKLQAEGAWFCEFFRRSWGQFIKYDGGWRRWIVKSEKWGADRM